MIGESPPVVVAAARGGFSVVYKGMALYSRVDPCGVSERCAASLPIQPETLYLVPSPLLGYGLKVLLDRVPTSSAVLALEADPELVRLTETWIPTGIRNHPRFRFLGDLSLATRALPSLGRFRRCVEVSLSYGRKLHPRAYDQALRSVDAELTRYWRNRMTMVHMGRLWVRNIVNNLSRLAEADIRAPSFWGSPIVVCGAGPSLDTASPWIERERGRLRVLACDTAVGPLRAHGIVPDAVVCLEGQIYNLKDFLPAKRAAAPVFMDLTAHPSTLHEVPGPKILTLSRFEELEFLDRLESLGLPLLHIPPLGSVGVVAVRLALSLSNGPIFLAGLDFSFTPGATHAKRSPALLEEAHREKRLYRAKAQWGASYARDAHPVGNGELSGTVLESYAALLGKEIEGNPRIVDIRSSGLPLGCKRTSFEEASLLLGPLPISGPLPMSAPVDAASLRSMVSSFLRGELGRVERLREALRTASTDLPAIAAESDWIYSWFPDEHRVLGLAGDVRNRLAAETVDWSRRLNQALDAMEET